MKTVLRLLICSFCLVALALPVAADDKEDDYETDARYAESAPPMIPHKVEGNATGESCLACHGSGLHGAPLTQHPERLDCTQCHGQGEIKAKKSGAKGKKIKKHKEGE